MTAGGSSLSGVLRFRVGLVGGLLLGAGGIWAFEVSNLLLLPPDPGVVAGVAIAGAQVSAVGGSTIGLSNSYESIRIDCRGACDDVRIDDVDTHYGPYDSWVRDHRGGCLSCGPPEQVDAGEQIVAKRLDGALVMTSRADGW